MERRERSATVGFVIRLVRRKPLGAFGAVVFLLFLPRASSRGSSRRTA